MSMFIFVLEAGETLFLCIGFLYIYHFCMNSIYV